MRLAHRIALLVVILTGTLVTTATLVGLVWVMVIAAQQGAWPVTVVMGIFLVLVLSFIVLMLTEVNWRWLLSDHDRGFPSKH